MKFCMKTLGDIIKDIENSSKKGVYDPYSGDRVMIITKHIDTIFMNANTYKGYFNDIRKTFQLCDKNLYLREDINDNEIIIISKGEKLEIINILDEKKLSFKNFVLHIKKA